AGGRYYLAEGTTAWGFTTYILIQNPNSTEIPVELTYMTDSGPVAHPENPIQMPAHSRKTVRVNDFLPGRDFSTLAEGEGPIITERAMYWNNGTGEAGHDSIGMPAAHSCFYLPDGETAGDGLVETWTLVQNPGSSDVTVEITYMTPPGGGNVTRVEVVPAGSRRTFGMAEHSGLKGRAAVEVRSRTAGGRIMVERAMYWNSRGAGANTIGAFSE
ncbi:MAG: hypothetical protein FJ313_06705, partial [Gemmatimonadetes bacterium]|nr:hypothetical protein [Gemmatimonadota bacterium]